MAEIIIEISRKDGTITIEGKEYQGTACMTDTDELEEVLGLRTTELQHKPEYAQRITTQQLRR